MDRPNHRPISASAPQESFGTRTASDFLASLVVFMVALPLCIGIAQASGLPPEAGLVTGIVGGLLVGFLAGSPLQVSGPAAGLIVLVIDFLDEAHAAGYAGPAAVAVLGVGILLAGALQVAAGLLRLGQWFRAVSPAVVGGMLAGIGVTIIAKQFHVMVDDAPPKGVVDGLLTIPLAVWKGFAPPPGAAADHSAAALIGLLTVSVLAAWKLLKPKVFRFIPSAVVAVVLAIAITEGAGFGIERVKVSSNLLDGLAPVHVYWPGWEIFAAGVVWKAAVTFALIASAETLLCATAVDSMHSGPRTKYDRELVAQGVGNMVCGAAGALPMTGVIVRSSANVDAGAKSRLSTILHGLWLLLFVSLFPAALSRIPLAALAAVLVYTGWKLVNPRGVAKLWRQSRGEALVYVATAAAIVATDLLTGVVTGVVLSAAKVLWMFSTMRVEQRVNPETGHIHLSVQGAGTFLRLPELAARLDAIPLGSTVHIHLDGLRLVDHAVLTLLMNFHQQHEAKGGTVIMDWERLQAHFQAPKLTTDEQAATPATRGKAELNGHGVLKEIQRPAV